MGGVGDTYRNTVLRPSLVGEMDLQLGGKKRGGIERFKRQPKRRKKIEKSSPIEKCKHEVGPCMERKKNNPEKNKVRRKLNINKGFSKETIRRLQC